ncbi:MAG: RluA family pseudouridine synthase [Clostridiales Family XIII bacterium]|jgi:23S rRNA pseudouridine1911/1915/1917 synthase|nr:RluA family pseudouridine synthase [Clostridiales Family XIII bacterium]
MENMKHSKNDLEYRITKEDEGHNIRQILKTRLFISVRLMKKIKYGDGTLTLNGEKVKTNERALAGDILAVRFPGESSCFEPEDIALDIIFEDEDLLIVNKQAGLVVHPTKGHASGTLANGVMKHMLDAEHAYKIRFINRLDMDTTGVLVVGKNAYSQEDFIRQAAAGGVTKRYTAISTGIIGDDAGRIDLPIAKAVEDQVKRAVREDGFPSATRFRVLDRFGGEGGEGAGFTLLELELDTGRTHQIRVHLSHIGHPVVGDVLYGEAAPDLIGRQALHARELAFRHPRTKESLRFFADLPDDMTELLFKLYSKGDMKGQSESQLNN